MNAVKEETRWINLRDKVNEIITKLSGKYPAYISNEVNKDYQIKTNAKLLNIILSNLIINAKKYSIKNTAITIKTTEYRTGLEFVIENIARPIERAEIYKLTHKNFRGSNTENFDDGVGLGLYEVNLLTRHTPMANIFIKPLDYKITKISDLEASFIFTVEFMEFKKQ
jgi:K+-sensing histidine kinase KdpD